MPVHTIRLLHRAAVYWAADTSGLRGRGSARSRHDDARDRAHTLARRLPGALGGLEYGSRSIILLVGQTVDSSSATSADPGSCRGRGDCNRNWTQTHAKWTKQ
jgi:hypothetical protein